MSWTWCGRPDARWIRNRRRALNRTSVRPGIAPAIGKRHVFQRPTRNPPWMIDWKTDRHQGEGEYIVGQAKNGSDILFVQDVIGRDQGAQPQATARQDDIFDCRIDARSLDP